MVLDRICRIVEDQVAGDDWVVVDGWVAVIEDRVGEK